MDGPTQSSPSGAPADGVTPPPPPVVVSARSRWGLKARQWVTRYGLAELGGVGGALLASAWVHTGTGSDIAAAYAATLGETAGFYGVVLVREGVQVLRAQRGRRTTNRFGELWGRTRWLVLEFGPAELADVAVIRPAAIGMGTMLLGRQLGVPVGKLVADVVFYGTVVSAYELQRRVARAAGRASRSKRDGASPSAVGV